MAKRKHRKTFDCGHRGYGQVCVRCQQAAQAADQKAQKAADRQQQRAAWAASFDQDPIDLRGLPQPVVQKSRNILTDLDQGRHFSTLGGKRMGFDRTVIRIPVGRRYRMLCRETAGTVVPWRVMSHEDYNAYTNNKRQIS